MEQNNLSQSVSLAVNDVMSTILGVDVSDNLKILDGDIKEKKISGVMLLLGDKKKLATISMSYNTAQNIVSYMTGLDFNDISNEEIYDGAAELVNMVLGRAKVFLVNTEDYFEITPPFTVIGDDHKFIIKTKLNEYNKVFILDDIELFISIFFID